MATYRLSKDEPIDNIVKTTTDVLLVMASLSGSDIELKNKVKFKSFKRKTRHLIISALEKVITNSDVKPYASLWKIAFHSLQVGEYGGKVSEIASRFRQRKKCAYWGLIVAEAIKNGDVDLAISKLIRKAICFWSNIGQAIKRLRG